MTYHHSFYCGITHDIMTDPVVVPCCGNTYDRMAAEQWIGANESCPSCRADLDCSMLVPNRALRQMIEDTVPRDSLEVDKPEEKKVPDASKPPVVARGRAAIQQAARMAGSALPQNLSPARERLIRRMNERQSLIPQRVLSRVVEEAFAEHASPPSGCWYNKVHIITSDVNAFHTPLHHSIATFENMLKLYGNIEIKKRNKYPGDPDLMDILKSLHRQDETRTAYVIFTTPSCFLDTSMLDNMFIIQFEHSADSFNHNGKLFARIPAFYKLVTTIADNKVDQSIRQLLFSLLMTKSQMPRVDFKKFNVNNPRYTSFRQEDPNYDLKRTIALELVGALTSPYNNTWKSNLPWPIVNKCHRWIVSRFIFSILCAMERGNEIGLDFYTPKWPNDITAEMCFINRNWTLPPTDPDPNWPFPTPGYKKPNNLFDCQ